MSQIENNSSTSKKFFYYGYWTVIAGSILVFLGSGVWRTLRDSISISIDFDSAKFLIFAFGSVALIPLAAGPLIDRFGPRIFIFLGIILSGIGMIGLKLSLSPGFMGAFLILAGIGYSVGYLLPLSVTTCNLFIRRRSFFLAVIFASGILGSYMMPIFFSSKGIEQSWSPFSLWPGIFILLIGFPLAFVIKGRPGKPDPIPIDVNGSLEKTDNSLITKDMPCGERHFTLKQSMKTKTFWLLAAAVALGYTAHFAQRMFRSLYVVRSGLANAPPKSPGVIRVLIIIAAILVFGYLGDKIAKRFLLALIVAVQSICVILVITAKSLSLIYVHDIILSLNPALTPLIFALCADYFGRRALATNYVFIGILPQLIASISPIGTVQLANRTVTISAVVIVLGLTAAIAFLMAKPPQPVPKNELSHKK